MWTKLIVKNFKSIGEKGVDLGLKPLTILVGPNGSGKSSILEAIAVLSATVGHNDLRLTGELVQFSGYEEVAHKHESYRWMTWEIRLAGDDGVRWEYKPDSGEEKETVIRAGHDCAQLSLEGTRQEGLQLMVAVPGQLPKGTTGNALPKFHGGVMLRALQNLHKDLPTPAEWEAAGNILDKVGANLKEKVFLLSALRGAVPPQGSTGEIPKWVGKHGEGVLTLLSLISNTPLYEEAWSKVQDWEARFGLSKLKAGIRGPNILAADYYDPEIRTTVNLAFAGQGSKQLIPVITQLFWAKSGSLVMIEEPEISLHPEAQVKLGELFADAIKEDKQIMISTHSHFLLLALNRAVANGLKVDDIAVYHITKGREGTKAAPVKLSRRGYPLGWPRSYEKVESKLVLSWSKALAEK